MFIFTHVVVFIYFFIFIESSGIHKKYEDKKVVCICSDLNKLKNNRIQFIYNTNNIKEQLSEKNIELELQNLKQDRITFYFRVETLISVLHDFLKCTRFLINNEKRKKLNESRMIYELLNNKYVKKSFLKFFSEYNPIYEKSFHTSKNLKKQYLICSEKINIKNRINGFSSKFRNVLSNPRTNFQKSRLKKYQNHASTRILNKKIKKYKYRKKIKKNIKKLCQIYFLVLRGLNKEYFYNKSNEEVLDSFYKIFCEFKNRMILKKCYFLKTRKNFYKYNYKICIFDILYSIFVCEFSKLTLENVIFSNEENLKNLWEQNLISNEEQICKFMKNFKIINYQKDSIKETNNQEKCRVNSCYQIFANENEINRGQLHINDKIIDENCNIITNLDSLSDEYDKNLKKNENFEEMKITNYNKNINNLQKANVTSLEKMVKESEEKLYTNDQIKIQNSPILSKEIGFITETNNDGNNINPQESDKSLVTDKKCFEKVCMSQDSDKTNENNESHNLNGYPENNELNKVDDMNKAEMLNSSDKENVMKKHFRYSGDDKCKESLQLNKIDNIIECNKYKEKNDFELECFLNEVNKLKSDCGFGKTKIDSKQEQNISKNIECELEVKKVNLEGITKNKDSYDNKLSLNRKISEYNQGCALSNIETNKITNKNIDSTIVKTDDIIVKNKTPKNVSNIYNSEISLDNFNLDKDEKQLKIQFNDFESFKNSYRKQDKKHMVLIALFDRLCYNKDMILQNKIQIKVTSFNNNYENFVNYIETFKDNTETVFFNDSGKKAIILLKDADNRLLTSTKENSSIDNNEKDIPVINAHPIISNHILDTLFYTHINNFESCFNLIDVIIVAKEFSRNEFSKLEQICIESRNPINEYFNRNINNDIVDCDASNKKITSFNLSYENYYKQKNIKACINDYSPNMLLNVEHNVFKNHQTGKHMSEIIKSQLNFEKSFLSNFKNVDKKKFESSDKARYNYKNEGMEFNNDYSENMNSKIQSSNILKQKLDSNLNLMNTYDSELNYENKMNDNAPNSNAFYDLKIQHKENPNILNKSYYHTRQNCDYSSFDNQRNQETRYTRFGMDKIKTDNYTKECQKTQVNFKNRNFGQACKDFYSGVHVDSENILASGCDTHSYNDMLNKDSTTKTLDVDKKESKSISIQFDKSEESISTMSDGEIRFLEDSLSTKDISNSNFDFLGIFKRIFINNKQKYNIRTRIGASFKMKRK